MQFEIQIKTPGTELTEIKLLRLRSLDMDRRCTLHYLVVICMKTCKNECVCVRNTINLHYALLFVFFFGQAPPPSLQIVVHPIIRQHTDPSDVFSLVLRVVIEVHVQNMITRSALQYIRLVAFLIYSTHSFSAVNRISTEVIHRILHE